jgi:hypothetical protein
VSVPEVVTGDPETVINEGRESATLETVPVGGTPPSTMPDALQASKCVFVGSVPISGNPFTVLGAILNGAQSDELTETAIGCADDPVLFATMVLAACGANADSGRPEIDGVQTFVPIFHVPN